MQLSHKYEVERMDLKTKIASLNERINNLGTMQQNKDRFIGAIRRFMEMQKLTAPLLRELIDEITVYETEGVGKNRSQRIMIHYKFIGYIEIPECGSNYKADTSSRCCGEIYDNRIARLKQKAGSSEPALYIENT